MRVSPRLRGNARSRAHHTAGHHRHSRGLCPALHLGRRSRHRRNWSRGFERGCAHDVAPLVAAARTFDLPVAHLIVGVGAITAMLGVALNLILGLSRVVLAMDAVPTCRACSHGWMHLVRRALPSSPSVSPSAPWRSSEMSGDLVVQRLHRVDLLRHHQSCRAPPAEGEATLLAAHRLGGACRLPGARLLRGARDLDDRAGADRRWPRLARFRQYVAGGA